MVMSVVTLEDYNASENQTAALKPGQVLVYDDTGRFAGETLTIFGREYQVAEILEEMAMQKSNFVGYSTLSVVTADMAEFSRIYEEQEKLQAASMKEQGVDPKAGDANSHSYSLVYTLGFDEDDMSEAQKDAVQGALDQLDNDGYTAVIEPALRQSGRDPFFSTLTLSADSSEEVRDAFYSLYGGMFFLGILLSITFLLGTVLIMYYKQITEGYDDQGRFEILRKVGMSDTEIRKTINSQVLTVSALLQYRRGADGIFRTAAGSGPTHSLCLSHDCADAVGICHYEHHAAGADFSGRVPGLRRILCSCVHGHFQSILPDCVLSMRLTV